MEVGQEERKLKGGSPLKDASKELRALLRTSAMYSQVADNLVGADVEARMESANENPVGILRARISDVSWQIAKGRAATFSDLAAKMEALVELVTGDPDDVVSAVAISAAKDLEAMLGIGEAPVAGDPAAGDCS